MATQKFDLGLLLMTRGVLQRLLVTEAMPFVTRHAQGDWGLVDDEDRAANEAALQHGDRLMSVYEVQGRPGERIWIITEADRSSTTVLLPEEY